MYTKGERPDMKIQPHKLDLNSGTDESVPYDKQLATTPGGLGATALMFNRAGGVYLGSGRYLVARP